MARAAAGTQPGTGRMTGMRLRMWRPRGRACLSCRQLWNLPPRPAVDQPREGSVAGEFDWAPGDWRRDIYEALRAADVRQVAYVPDAGHASLIRACHADDAIRAIVLTTEEEGIGVLAGAHLGGQRGVLLMQSSGVGNCVNTFSLIRNCGFPMVAIVTMRGEWGEFNPWQVPMGQGTEQAMKDGGFVVHRLERADEVGPAAGAALSMAFDGGTPVALLLSQRLIGAKKF